MPLILAGTKSANAITARLSSRLIELHLQIESAMLFIASCATQQIGIKAYTGFTELPFPSNIYGPGQIVTVHSSPRKVNVTFDPQIPWDQAVSSEGWDISSTETDNIKTKFETEIIKILKGSASYNSSQTVKVSFTNTKVTTIPTNKIFAAIDSSLRKDDTLVRMLKAYIKNGTHYDVVTQALKANISFSIVDTSNSTVKVDSEIIEKINSNFNIDFSKDSDTNKVISGSNLVVGLHYDPGMIGIILSEI